MQTTDTYPIELSDSTLASKSRSPLFYGGITLAMAVVGAGAGAIWGQMHHTLPAWKPVAVGVAVSAGFGLAYIFVRAAADTKRMSIIKKAQNLLEDAWTSHALGDVDKAEKELIEALEMARDGLGAADMTTLLSLHSLANLYRVRKQYGNADTYYQQALSLYDKVLPPNHSARANLHYHVSLNFDARGNLSKAIDQAQQSVAVWRKVKPPDPLSTADVLSHLGRLYVNEGQDKKNDKSLDEKALQAFSEALELQSKLSTKDPMVLANMSQVSRIYVKLRRYKESEQNLIKVIEELDQSSDPNYVTLTEANLDLGLIRIEQGQDQQAEPHFVRALQLLQHYVGPNERLLQRALQGYQKLFKDQSGGVVDLLSVFYAERELIRKTLEDHPEWINARDNTGWGPIQWAIFIGRGDIMGWLLTRGADPGYDSNTVMGPVHVACAWNRPDELMVLLEKQAEVNARGPGGWTPVFWCSMTGQDRMLDILLKKNAQINIKDDYGLTPLHIAAARDRLRVAATLVGNGALVNAKDPNTGQTPLHIAAERGYLAVCDCLIFNGANIEEKDAQGATPLQLAQKKRHNLLVRAMKKHLQSGLGKNAKKSR